METKPMDSVARDLIKLCDAACARKKKYFLSQLHYPMDMDSYWSGGSRDVYHIVDVITKKVARLPSNHPVFEPGRPYTLARPLPENFIVIQTGVFCGKTATPHIYVQDLDQLLEPDEPDETAMAIEALAAAELADSRASDEAYGPVW